MIAEIIKTQEEIFVNATITSYLHQKIFAKEYSKTLLERFKKDSSSRFSKKIKKLKELHLDDDLFSLLALLISQTKELYASSTAIKALCGNLDEKEIDVDDDYDGIKKMLNTVLILLKESSASVLVAKELSMQLLDDDYSEIENKARILFKTRVDDESLKTLNNLNALSLKEIYFAREMSLKTLSNRETRHYALKVDDESSKKAYDKANEIVDQKIKELT